MTNQNIPGWVLRQKEENTIKTLNSIESYSGAKVKKVAPRTYQVVDKNENEIGYHSSGGSWTTGLARLRNDVLSILEISKRSNICKVLLAQFIEEFDPIIKMKNKRFKKTELNQFSNYMLK